MLFKKSKYLAENDYTIADIATWPWVARFEWHQIDIRKYESVADWYTNISNREAVKKDTIYHLLEPQYQKYKSYLISNYI